MIGRRFVPALVALVLAVGLLPVLGATAVRAAPPDLTLVTTARYEVQPDERRVRVTVDIVARNRLRDTATRRFFFDSAFLAVQPGARGFELTAESGSPAVRVSETRETYQVLALSFGRRIFSQQSGRFRLTFELPDAGGTPTREIRVGTAFTAFPVWAFATEETPGSAVEVVFPEGFDVRAEAGELPEPATDREGRTVFEWTELDDPLSFFVYLVGDRETEFRETLVGARLGDTVARATIRAWPDDPDWAERVAGLFDRGLPVLHRQIGIPLLVDGRLVVEETVSRSEGGYAGMFDPRDGQIEIAYYADAFVVLHELAHAWFNGALLTDRWANEAFASYYAEQAARALGEEVDAGELTDEQRESAFPLNAWAPAARSDPKQEDYGYAASLTLARAIVERAGSDGLRRVWVAASAREGAYQPPPVDPAAERAPEPAGPPDWRALLDLLEERTGQRYDDLWREWVVREDEAALLDERRAARGAYAALLREAGRWELPISIRSALRAWEFEEAVSLLDEARGVLEQRTALEAAATAAGLRLPTRLETAFESGAEFEAARLEAAAEMAAIEVIEGAAASRPAEPDPLQQIGLIGEVPDETMASSRDAFAEGDLERSAREALTARQVWESAWEVGRNRALVAAGVVLLILLALGVLASLALGYRRRRRRRAAEALEADAEGAPDGAGSERVAGDRAAG